MGIKERWGRSAPLPEDILGRLERLEWVFKREGVEVAFLFGSLAHGEEAEDIDLAVQIPGKPVFRLREAVARLLGTERIDLVDLDLAPPHLRFEILRTGRCLYAASESSLERFILDTLRTYRDTHYLRSRQRAVLRERTAS